MVDAAPPPSTAASPAAGVDVGTAPTLDIPEPEHPPVPGQYQVNIELFEGPFDLLLQLIAKRRLDVTQVDLADITRDFLASLDALDLVDLETATRFLVVAATLIEMKAARLLPTEQRDDLDDLLGEARDVLYARLLEYRAFRDVAHDLGRRFELQEAYVARDVPLDHRWRKLVPETALPIGPEDLARIAAWVTRPIPEPTITFDHIRRSFISIRDAATRVLTDLTMPGRSGIFRELVAGETKGDAVVFFLAVLELYKLGALQLDQDDHRGDLLFDGVDEDIDVTVLANIDEDQYEAATDSDDESDDEPEATDADVAVQIEMSEEHADG